MSQPQTGRGPTPLVQVELWTRALLFYAGLAVSTLILAPVCVLSLPMRFGLRYRVVSIWVHFNMWWLAKSCRLTHRVEGLENVPDTPAVVLCKHQSAWETIALNLIFRPQVWVLKRELLCIPLFGWALAALRPIAIDRSAGLSAIEQVIRQGRERLAAGCWVVVFPEGTRVAPGERGRYRFGGAKLAQRTGCPVVPVAHNAGDYWPRNSFLKRPGSIRVVIGPPITSERRRAVDINRLAEEWIESTVARIRSEEATDAENVEATQCVTPAK